MNPKFWKQTATAVYMNVCVASRGSNVQKLLADARENAVCVWIPVLVDWV